MVLVFPAMSEAQRYSIDPSITIESNGSQRYSIGKMRLIGEKIARIRQTVSVSCTSSRYPKNYSRSYCRSSIGSGGHLQGSGVSHSTFPDLNCNEYTTSNSIMALSMASKNSVDDVYIEQLNTEDPHMERRVLRKIDFRLLPILGALYTIALIDRTNISVARISGLDDDLDLKVGNRASVVLLVSTAQDSFLYRTVY